MKTVQLVFVVDDADRDALDHDIHELLEGLLSSFPVFMWKGRKASNAERQWRRRHDAQRSNTAGGGL